MHQHENLFSDAEIIPWKAEWQGMPEYSHEDLLPRFQVLVSFTCESDLIDFNEKLGISVPATKGRQTKSIWFPEQEIAVYANKRYIQK
jgi:hypothetical protein